MDDLFPYAVISLIVSNYLSLLVGFVCIAVISVAYFYLVSVFSWNSMIDRRNADMGSSGWKYGKRGFWN